jgi:glutamate formiminotransferase/formiminotetrahydrofolate cyclodeaminase
MEKQNMLISNTLADFVNEVASNSPAPGGGSVSALTAALGFALVSMVCRLTIGKKKYADVQTEMERVLKQSEESRLAATRIIDEDTEAFDKVMAAFTMPKESEDQKSIRSESIQEATNAATLVPLRLAQLCAEGIALARVVAEKGNTNSLSDAGVAACMLAAACEGAAMNVKINLSALEDKIFVGVVGEEINSYLEIVRPTAALIVTLVNSKI